MSPKMKKPFNVGAKVRWTWMGRPVYGDVKKIYFKPISKVFRGHLFKRNGSEDKPAYLIVTIAGNEVLKSQSELRKAK